MESLAERVRTRREPLEPGELRQLRKKARISVRELAETVGVSESAIVSYERGVRWPRGTHLDRLLVAVRVLKGAPVETVEAAIRDKLVPPRKTASPGVAPGSAEMTAAGGGSHDEE